MSEEESKRGRGRPRSFDQDAALDRAMRVFWERGYEGSSLDVLLTEMQISPSSLYAVYGGKEQLFEAALSRYLSGPGGYFGPILEADIPAREAFQRLAEAVAEELTRPDQPRGCMLSLALNHCAPAAAAVQNVAKKGRDGSLAAFRRRLEKAVANGELPPDTNVESLARYYLTMFQGMSVQARDGASRGDLVSTAKWAAMGWPI